MFGLFLVLTGIGVFGGVTYEKAMDICHPDSVDKGCIVKAMEPIETANHGHYND